MRNNVSAEGRVLTPVNTENVKEKMAASGLRVTPQREHVLSLFEDQLDHPTAEQVFLKSKETMPDISMATVYNCLEKFVDNGLLRLVQLDRGATRYCPNMHDHSHFYCEDCGDVFDVDFDRNKLKQVLNLPDGMRPVGYEVAIRGVCPGCKSAAKLTS